MTATPRFIQGTFSFTGSGLDTPIPLGPRSVYQVPPGKRAQLVYLRAGNAASELVTLLFTRNGRPLRYFPLGAKSAHHVSLAITEDIFSESELALMVLAPEALEGTVVVDVGLVELPEPA